MSSSRKSHKVPEVVEFEDPSQRRKRGSKRPRESKDEAEDAVADDEKYQVSSDFQSIWKSVTELGASTFKGRDKKIWEARKLESLGVRVQHVEKMPRKMWMGVKKKRESRAARQEEERAAADLVTGKGRAHAKLSSNKKKAFVADPSKSLDGKDFRNGVMHVGSHLSGAGHSSTKAKRSGGARGKRR